MALKATLELANEISQLVPRMWETTEIKHLTLQQT